MCCHKIFKIASEQEPDFDGVRRTRWLIVRDTYLKLEKTTIKTWRDWYPPEDFGAFRETKPPTHFVRVPHMSGDGTTIDAEVINIAIASADDVEEIAASFEITGFWINEMQFTEKGVVDELLSRCGRFPSPARGPGATWYGGFADMNAPLEGHWLPYMRGDVAMPTEWSKERRRELEKPAGWKFFVQPAGLIERVVDGRPSYFENPAAENQQHLAQSYLQQIQGKTKEWIDRRVMNKTGLYSGGKPVYPSYMETDHASPHVLRAIDEIPIYVGLDFGRDPAAAIGQCANGDWQVLEELIGDNEPAVEFAPRLKRFLSSKFPGRDFIFGGDPRGSDRSQISNVTAYEIFQKHGMRVTPATSDNNPSLRRNTVNAVLLRRNGLLISKSCLTLRTGLGGGYHYRKIRGTGGYSESPHKNHFSHVVEAFENMLIIAGEGDKVVRSERARPMPVQMPRRKIRMRRFQ